MLEIIPRTAPPPVSLRPCIAPAAVATALAARAAAPSAMTAPLPAAAVIGAPLSFARLAVLPVRAGGGLVRRLLPVSTRWIRLMGGPWRIRAGSRRLELRFRRHAGAQLRNYPSQHRIAFLKAIKLPLIAPLCNHRCPQAGPPAAETTGLP